MSSSRLSKLADADLLSIFRYTIETWGAEQVPLYLSLLESARDRIAADPFTLGSKSREDLAEGCRTYRVEKHYFVYRIKNDTVEIGRILHQAMGFESQVEDQIFD